MITATPTRPGSDWRAILLLFYSILAMLFLLAGGFLSGLIALFRMNKTPNPQYTAAFILAGGFCLCALVLGPAIYFSGQRVLGRPEQRGRPMRLTARDWALFLLGWPLVLLISTWLIKQDYGWLVAPLFTFTSVLLPIWLLVKLGAHNLPLDSPLRRWGALGTGLAFTPMVIIIIEGLLFVVAAVVVVIIISAQPATVEAMRRFTYLIQNADNEAQVLALMQPYLASPYLLYALLAALAIGAPLVEELFKTSVLWFMGRRAQGPAEGFALGLLSGAGFALFETLGASGNSIDAWSATMLTRGGTDIMHILTSGLMGWAVVSVVQEKRYARFLATLFCALTIHGLWNASTVFMVLGALYITIPGAPAWGINAVAGGVGGLLTLTVGGLIVLALSNRRLRASLPPSADSDSLAPLAVTTAPALSEAISPPAQAEQ